MNTTGVIETVLAEAMQCGECEGTGQGVVGYDHDMTPRFGPCQRCAHVAAAVRAHLLSDAVVERAGEGIGADGKWDLHEASRRRIARAALAAAVGGDTE